MSDLRFVQAGVGSWLQSMFPSTTVLWDNSEHPRAATTGTVLLARVISGPRAEGFSSASRLLPTRVVFRLGAGAAVAGASMWVGASGRRWEYTTQAGESVEDARDGLLAVMQAAPTVLATISARDTDGIEVSADDLGDLWNLVRRGPVTLEIEASELAETNFGDVHYTLEVEARSTGRYPRDAMQAVSRIQSRMRSDDTALLLSRYGIAVNEQAGTSIIPIPTLSGSKHEGRAAIRFGLSQMSVVAVPAVEIEIVEFTFTELDLDEEFQIP